jgi:hypothetical protein
MDFSTRHVDQIDRACISLVNKWAQYTMNNRVNLAGTTGGVPWSVECRKTLTAFLGCLLMFAPASVFCQDVQAKDELTQLSDVAWQKDSDLKILSDGTPTSADGPSVAAEGCECDANTQNAELEKEKEKQKQKQLADLKKKVASAYKGVFYENDFSYLCDPSYGDYQLGENFKQLSLPRGGNYDLGGQFRLRGQFERNMRGLGLTGLDDNFLLYRTRVYGDFRLRPNLRFYAELLDAESTSEQFAPRPIEVNRADMLNLFFDARLMANEQGELKLRIGTQELAYGAERVISPLDWANTRRTFQGIKGFWKGDKWDVDAFWTNPMRIDDSEFDSPDRDQEFMGVWSTYKGRKDHTVDVYALRYLNGRGLNNFENNTLGGALVGCQRQQAVGDAGGLPVR